MSPYNRAHRGRSVFWPRRPNEGNDVGRAQNDAYFANLYWGIKSLQRSDPMLETPLLEMMETYTAPVISPPEYPNIEFEVFCNNSPDFTDTNNLSLVLFLHFPGLSVVFPGDLEKPGWRTLLQSQIFRGHLFRVNVFIASHHGRESGYVKEVFDVCHPDIVIISDESMQFDTQENCYGNHAKGITWNQSDIRRVLTTRKDGSITITNHVGNHGYSSQSVKGGLSLYSCALPVSSPSTARSNISGKKAVLR